MTHAIPQCHARRSARAFASLGLCIAAGLSPAVAMAGPQESREEAESQEGDARQRDAKRMETVTVTGSLIPQVEVETAAPLITITADTLKARGFASVADALKQSSFASGSVQGSQTSASFTQGAETLSLFGMPPGFTKYLIDGRPMGNFPALYNGRDVFNNLSGIPMQLVDRIEILPGAQSSLYGSDAIAGVVNIILKKKVEAPSVDVRYGFYQAGGGASRRLSYSDGFNRGRFNLMGGVQYEKIDPIWGYDRPLTSTRYQHGTSPARASGDYMLASGTTGRYINVDRVDDSACSRVAGQYAGTTMLASHPTNGTYCGSLDSPGYRTLSNGKESAQAYTHATYDASDNVRFYGDLLYNYDETRFASGSGYTWWGTSSKWGYYYDPNLQDYVQMQRIFAPEDMGGYRSIMNKYTENAYMLALGAQGRLGATEWDYDLGFTHSDDQLTQRGFARWADAINDYFEQHVLGPDLGPDPRGRGYSTYAPDYAAFYEPMSVEDFRSFTGFTRSHSKTWDNLLRGQLTNASLFALPGGDAGLAAVVEGGNQGWDYTPDARLMNGGVWGTTAVQGAGHRSRYAGTLELRAPVLKQVTVDLSGRYDDYKVNGKQIDKATWNLGLEYRPFDTLLLRGKLGTAFKAPSLSDQFQGLSGAYSRVVDYYNCAVLGYRGANIDSCPARYGNVQYFSQQEGNPALKPIRAKAWSYGVVWSPLARMSVSLDYLHWNVRGEVQTQSADSLSNDEMLCRLGERDIHSPSCVAALSQITRGVGVADDGTIGAISRIYRPKVNVARRVTNALVADARYGVGLGAWGDLSLNASYSNMLKHRYQPYTGDPMIDLLRDPTWSTEFKTRTNASATWSAGRWASTLYVNRYGKSPNYLAQNNGYDYPGAGTLAPWIRYNASVSFQPVPSLQLALQVNNLFNTMPPKDGSYPGTSGAPYNSSNYDVYGRAYYLQATYRFGERKS
ncbi:TonB-dependent receptor domain-containing protein [Dyella sedimenti]|uniref:TonB-dependent receptor domain-containing protein n=1 Tax=Dyella sedimenti TaxID=2919947 RepID=UPI001FAAEF89|nr:TonB-dependent receptor [Dyella sedimenti]